MTDVKSISLPPKKELQKEFESGRIPRSKTWQAFINGLYLNTEQFDEIISLNKEFQQLSNENQTINTNVNQKHSQIDGWQQQVLSDKTASANSAQVAATSATNAQASKTAAATSATNAQASKTAAAISATNAQASKMAAATSAANAQASKTAAATSATDAQASKMAAATSATNAQASKTAAATSATDAQTSKTAAATSATNAQTSESASKASEQASEQAKNKAKKWANQPHSIPVETNQYSSLHYAEESKKYADTITNGMYFAGSWNTADGLPSAPTGQLVPWYRIVGNKAKSIRNIAAAPGDQLCWDPSNKEWFIIDTTDQVTSVNGQIGLVTLDADDVGARSDSWVPSTVDVASGQWRGKHTDMTRRFGESYQGGEVFFGYKNGKGHVIVDGEFYADEGKHKVYHPGNKPTWDDVDNKPMLTGGRKNLLINGNKTINQRNFDGNWSSKSVGEYGYDRWKKHGDGIEQIIEGGWFGAGVYTLSWQGAGSGLVNGTTVANGGTFYVANATHNISVVVPEAATLIQLELGSVATEFERTHIGTEEELCRLYFERKHYFTHLVNIYSANLAYTVFYFSKKRANPTVTFDNSITYGNQIHFPRKSRAIQSISPVGIVSNSDTTCAFPVSIQTATGMTGGCGHIYIILNIDAEL